MSKNNNSSMDNIENLIIFGIICFITLLIVIGINNFPKITTPKKEKIIIEYEIINLSDKDSVACMPMDEFNIVHNEFLKISKQEETK